MKKIIAMVMAITMVLTLSACGNIKDVTKMASIGEDSADKGVFNYYFAAGKNMAMQMASQNGAELTAESAEKDWETVMIEEKSAKQYAIDYAVDAMKSSLVLKAKAIADGIKLTDEDKASISSQRDQFIESYGGRYNYEQYITELGFTLEDVEKVIENDIYGQKVVEKYFGNGTDEGEIKVSDDEIKKVFEEEYVMAKHILISNQPETEVSAEEAAPAEGEEAPAEDAETEEAAPAESAAPVESAAPTAEETEKAAEEADKAAKAKAEEIIKKLADGADFDALMKENTDDKNAETGEINGANGYVFTKGEMVKEFEEEAFKLEVNAMSKAPVATDYGYHILWKLPLPTEGEEYDNAIASVKNKVLSDKMEEMIDKWAEELGFKANEKAISKIKIVK